MHALAHGAPAGSEPLDSAECGSPYHSFGHAAASASSAAPTARRCGRLQLLLTGALAAAATLAAIVWTLPATLAPREQELGGMSTTLAESMRSKLSPPKPCKRCAYVVEQLTTKHHGIPHALLQKRYANFVQDASSFYRGTAVLFWRDFVENGWGLFDLTALGLDSSLADDAPLQRTSTWTWITGDQHLSNFGAWRNRHGDVVFGMNDFDEAVIYDFHLDVWRLAVSVYTHALANGLDPHQAEAAVFTLCDAYVSTLVGYVGNERALTYELTAATARGKLQQFLADVSSRTSHHKQLRKFTAVGADGARRFVRDDGGKTKLASVPTHVADEVRRALGAFGYGATMSKIGWHARLWDPADNGGNFSVLDVARRVGSGVGSYGVDRFYVLFSGKDADGVNVYDDSTAEGIILDVKFEPPPAAAGVFNAYDAAWYHGLFPNHAARATFAQRALTSYTDPFAGWALINGSAHLVRQRSPWKASFDLNQLTSYAEFTEFVRQVTVVTATSHARGTVGKSPAQFKEIISSVLGSSSAKATWSVAVSLIASTYHKQVKLDFECFREYYEQTFGALPSREEGEVEQESMPAESSSVPRSPWGGAWDVDFDDELDETWMDGDE